MPQVDLATFHPILFWTAVIYFVGLFAISIGPLLAFLSSLKVVLKRSAVIGELNTFSSKLLNGLTTFPLIGL